MRKLYSIVALGIIALVVFLHELDRVNIHIPYMPESPAHFYKRTSKANKQTSFLDEISDRKNILNSVCRGGSAVQDSFSFSRNDPIFYVSANANITYCKVPKAGSSLISALFLLMVGKPVTPPVHAPSVREFGQSWPLPDQSKPTFKFMVARDPYTRLYSAYVDKYYLVEHHSIIRTIQKIKNNGYYMVGKEHCGYDITFQDFLHYSLDIALRTKQAIDHHWSPLHLICRPCDIDYHVIAKQETLSRDLSYIMDHMNISTEMKHLFSQTIWRDSTCERILDLFKTRFSKMENCQSKRAYAYRIWESFKIQGYIRADLTFPFLDNGSTEGFSEDGFCEIVRKYMKDYPLSRERKAQQRHHYLVAAFSTIDDDAIVRIKTLYKFDFIAFGYSSQPPA